MRKRTKNRLVVFLGILAIAGAVAYAYWPRDQAPRDKPHQAKADPMGLGPGTAGGSEPTLANLSDPPSGQPDQAPPPVPDPNPEKSGPIDPRENLELLKPQVQMSPAQAKGIYDRCMAILGRSEISEAQMLAVRTNLSAAYFSHQLSQAQQDRARQALTKLANETILSPKCYDGDPYTFYYDFKKGDVIARVIDKNHLALRVPDELILMVNPEMNPRNIWPGTRLKFVKGPFHAAVYKDRFVMDIYLRNHDGPITFVRRVPIGIGKNDATPSGAFQVTLDKKIKHANWNPPPGSKVRTTVLYDMPGHPPGEHPDYPLGKEGWWISLTGLEEKNQHATGYGMHGTNEPETVGKAASLGCIRMKDDDIEFVYAVLYVKWSTVHLYD
jgi:hypothetical protein